MNCPTTHQGQSLACNDAFISATFDYGMCYHMLYFAVAYATTQHVWLWLAYGGLCYHSPHLAVACATLTIFGCGGLPQSTSPPLPASLPHWGSALSNAIGHPLFIVDFFKLPSFQTFPQIHIARIKLVVCN